MARQVNQALWNQWRQRMERQRESGLSIAEFCRRESISPHGFHGWRRKFRQATPRRPASGKVAAARPSRVVPRCRGTHGRASPAAPTRSTGFLQLPVTEVRPNPWIELALADGTIVRLPQQNLAALIAVLRLLRGERLELSLGERCDA